MTQLRSNLLALAGLLVLTLAMFADVLFAGGTRVLSHQGTDLLLQYYSWRDFGFSELAKGHLALWNPYIFGGAPFFGGMQSALLYPLNWLFLLLPMAKAINWTIALNIFGLGAFVFCWLRVRGLVTAASFFGGAMAMLSGPHFLHVFGGHLPQMATMTWSPLIFCAIDGLFHTRKFGWCLLGMFAVAMQVLAGFPQYVFYVGIIAGLYALLRLIIERSWWLALTLFAIYVGGFVLTAVQLLPGIEATSETVRGIRVPFEFASQCSLPPENFLTLLAPHLLGGTASYWGRCYLWETSVYVGITTLFLAIYAFVSADRCTKWISTVVIFAALVLALGEYTPLFRLLYDYAPGFDRLRATAKFIFPASLFLILLSATGIDRLLKQSANPKLVIGVFGFALVLLIGGVWAANTNSFIAMMQWMQQTHETYLRPDLYQSAEFLKRAQSGAATSLFVASGVAVVIAVLLFLRKRSPNFGYAIIAVGLGEMICFAAMNRPTFDSETIVNKDEKSFLAAHPGDYRILDQLNPNSAMSLRVPNLWGYDPNVVRRYAEFITWTQRGDPNNATLYVRFTQFDSLYAMLRLEYVFGQRDGQFESAESPIPPLPHVQLISDYRVLHGRDGIFEAIRSPDFDPTRSIILESEPDPKPEPLENPGMARIKSESTDELTIEADLNRPSILLITDVYTPAWKAVSLPGSVQSKYQLLPANYVLRAVPLAAGHHNLRVEYSPRGFAIGKWISIISTILFVAAVVRWRRPFSIQ